MEKKPAKYCTTYGPPLTMSSFSSPFEDLINQMTNEVFSAFPNRVKSMTSVAYPKTDVYKRGQDLVLEAFVPFVKKEDLRVEWSDSNVLTISGEVSEEHKSDSKGKDYYLKELRRSNFSRSFIIPEENIKSHTGIEAHLDEGGILKVVVKNSFVEPKPPERKLIEIT